MEDEVEVALREAGQLDLDELAARLKVSRESALYFLGRLVREGKASISAVKGTGKSPTAGETSGPGCCGSGGGNDHVGTGMVGTADVGLLVS